jgi:hypothetical protein
MRLKNFLRKALIYIRNILLVDLGLSLLVAFSFLFTRGFTVLAYSERIFYTGLVITLIAFVVGLAAGFSGKSFGIPMFIRKPEEAKNLLDNFGEYRDLVEQRYDTGIQIFLVGLGCVVVGALVQVFLT